MLRREQPDLLLLDIMMPEVSGLDILEQLRATFTGPPFLGAHLHVLFGDPGHEIVDLASEIGAELIIMPSHGRRGVKRVLLGSVAERVARLAECPVLVLRE